MARRILLGQRSDGQFGMFLAPPGVDAYYATDSQLLFSPFLRRYMRVQAGTVTLGAAGSGRTVSFPTLASKPLVFIGFMHRKPSPYPCKAVVGLSSFTAYPDVNADGTYPAAGMTVPYIVVAKTQA